MCVRFREHIVLTLEPSPDNTVCPTLLSLFVAIIHVKNMPLTYLFSFRMKL